MEVDNSHSGSEEEQASDTQPKTDWMEGDEYCSETNDVTPSDATDSQSNCRRTRQAYTLPFKLSVVEAYRNDGECKGNQRATARKFHIHRRQVQRWIRDERALSQKFRLRVAAAGIARDSAKTGFSHEALGNETFQHRTSSFSASTCETEQNIGYAPTDVAGRKRCVGEKEPAMNESTFGHGPQREDAAIDLSIPRRGHVAEDPTVSNAGNYNPKQSVKQTVLAAYQAANKWHGITAGVAQKFGIMVSELVSWLREEQESKMLFSPAVFPREPPGLSGYNVLPPNAHSTGAYTYLPVLRQQAESSEAHCHMEICERSAATSGDFCKSTNTQVDAIFAGEALKCLYRQISRLQFHNYRVMNGPFAQCPAAPHGPSSHNSLPQMVHHNAQFPAVRPVSPVSEDED